MEISTLLSCFQWLLLLLTSAVAFPYDGVIQTTSGPVLGFHVQASNGLVRQYLGVPFAKPPVGNLRFKKPQPVERRNETIVASAMPPACVQYVAFPFPWYDSQDGQSEDCLYLNVWAPVTADGRPVPVLFWIYGGGFTVGSNRKDVYRGQDLASFGQVVVVTVNYRMSALGFLTSDTEDAPGNAGMFDMLEALKWVNRNIAAFGGDPGRVTLAGQSAGSIAVGLLCVSPLTSGLFRRVIMESGSPAYLNADNSTASVATSQQLAKAVGCADDDHTIEDNPREVVNCLREKDAMDLVRTISSFHPTSARSFFPSYGDELLPTNARKALIAGQFHDVDVLIGNNLNEGIFQLPTGHPNEFGFFGQKAPPVNKSYGASLINATFKDFEDPEAVVQHYLGDVDDGDYDQIRLRVATSGSDYSLLCPTVYFAETYAKKGNNVYYYFFTHRPSPTPWAQWMGVVHYEEVQFVFGEPLRSPAKYTYQEQVLSRQIMQLWSNFARDGLPLKNWQEYSRDRPEYRVLDTQSSLRTGYGPNKDNCDFFRPYFGFV